MTTPSDELLMAYADGELDAVQREQVRAAIDADPVLARRVRGMAALRKNLQRALQPELDEPVPERLLQALRPQPAADVVNLADVRTARTIPPARHPGWAQWGGMAACLVLGVALARWWPASEGGPFETLRGGQIVARGEVDRVLSGGLAADPAAPGRAAVQLSFVDHSGAYCRTFTIEALAGLACRQGESWAVQALVAGAQGPSGAMRPAATDLPPALLTIVDNRIEGAALDAADERAARERGWKR
jgi:anti-sigma factor RsiW